MVQVLSINPERVLSSRWDTVPSVCFGNVMKHNHILFQCCHLRSYFLCFTGIVRTSVIVTGVQVFSRIFMVWFIANSIRQVTVPLSSSLWCVFPSRLTLTVSPGLNQDPE